MVRAGRAQLDGVDQRASDSGTLADSADQGLLILGEVLNGSSVAAPRPAIWFRLSDG